MTDGIPAAAVAAYIWIAEGGLRICLDTFGYLLYETQHSLTLMILHEPINSPR